MGRQQRRGGALGATLVVVLFFVASCGGDSAKQHVSTYAMTHPKIVPNPAKSHNPDSFYVPDPIRVHVGQSITWTNKDTDPHDVTSDNGVFFSGPMADGATFRWTPSRPGTYRYFCTVHPEMQGTIIVSR